ncbi:DUF4232 domain-containing protein [Lentzea sp. HUAS12]|uniref:DUF4232 domain-containing protein n=1 Tax=Lentzea sp. HUAS12 TaxID=2951806 RepID=UPI00209FF1C4|nr:DUF4232 domain-containing protein [Lentzea sp. HUAS12]USX55599.1 DUF4232 domain-containing protein [Lentzea sp. HUAS12]
MNIKHRSAAGLGVTALLAAAVLPLAAGTASANPSDQPCDVADLVVSVTKDPYSSAGQEAFVLHYEAAGPTTNCKLQGVPTGVTFTKGSGHGEGDGSGITVVPDNPGSDPAPVNVRPGKAAESRILMSSQEPESFLPDVVNLNLPVEGGHTTTVGWPDGQSLRGSQVEVTDVSPA